MSTPAGAESGRRADQASSEPGTALHVAARVALVASAVALFVVEVLATLSVRAPYDVARQAVSDLGALACGPLETYDPPLQVCSPTADVLNATWVATGLVVAVAAWLVRPRDAGAAGTVGVVMLALAGVAQAASGLLPVDVSPEPHVLVALLGFLAQAIGLPVLGLALWRGAGRPRLGRLVLRLGAVTVVAAILLAVMTAGPAVAPLGLVERAIIYPFQVWMIVFGLTARTDRR